MKHFSAIISLTFSLVGFSQISIEGTVQTEQGEAIPYAAIGIENTAIGTSSNSKGVFRIQIPNNRKHENIVVSHLGYQNKKLKIDGINENIVIQLTEALIELDEVVVSVSSAYQMIERVIEKIPDNYDMGPVTYQFYTSQVQFIKEEPAYLVEVVANMYRPKGPSRKSDFEMLKIRGKPSSSKFKSEFKKARTSFLTVINYAQVERQSSWGLEYSEMKFYDYSFDTLVYLNEKLTQVILAEPNERGLRKEKKILRYYIDVDTDAVSRAMSKSTESGFGMRLSTVDYQLIDEKWYIRAFDRHFLKFDDKSSNRTLFMVTDIVKGLNDSIEPLGYRYVQEIKHKLGDWNDSFWEDYNYIVLDDIWRD